MDVDGAGGGEQVDAGLARRGPGRGHGLLLSDRRSTTVGAPDAVDDGRPSRLPVRGKAAFGADVDYAQLVKLYGEAPAEVKGRYSPTECVGIRKRPVIGQPDPAAISTSYVEWQNLNIRMGNRRFTRLTNAFSKKLANHAHMLAAEPYPVDWLVTLVEARTPPPTPRGPDRQPRRRCRR